MKDKKIFIIGYEEVVILLGLLGIDGKIIESSHHFIEEFQNIVQDQTIGMIIISMDLPDDLLNYLIEFKTNHRYPFIFYLPDIFSPNFDTEGLITNIINESLGKNMF